MLDPNIWTLLSYRFGMSYGKGHTVLLDYLRHLEMEQEIEGVDCWISHLWSRIVFKGKNKITPTSGWNWVEMMKWLKLFCRVKMPQENRGNIPGKWNAHIPFVCCWMEEKIRQMAEINKDRCGQSSGERQNQPLIKANLPLVSSWPLLCPWANLTHSSSPFNREELEETM